jgi:hypothetical protein
METEEFEDKPEKEGDADAEQTDFGQESDSGGGEEESSEQTGAEEGGGF